MTQSREPEHGLHRLGILRVRAHWNLTQAALYGETLERNEGMLAEGGALVVHTMPHTGRSPRDKFIVREPSSQPHIAWGPVNHAIQSEHFERLRHKQLAYLQGRDVYVFDGYAGADPQHRLAIRVVTELAWHNLFARNLFIAADRVGPPLPAHAMPAPSAGTAGPADSTPGCHEPKFTVISTPGLKAVPETDGTRSGAFILVHFGEGLVLIGGTSYAGEIKKSIFTVMNYLLPFEDVLPMHCSANYGRHKDDVALFFGLSGTGKTTLSTDPERTLVGDDEHGWSDTGVFNFEGGCYAKTIGVRPDTEPEIYATTRMFGTVLENVVIDPKTRRLDLDDARHTENTRAAYPLAHIPRADPDGRAGHPRHIIMLACDAFGVLPPIAKLSPQQAQRFFLLGYTAKVAGTETGVTEPKATFSTCFGAPFMPQQPTVYAALLTRKIAQHRSQCWLVNTGWTGGPFGVGKRMRIDWTRALVRAALADRLESVATVRHPIFGLQVPTQSPGIPSEVLDPRRTWSDGDAYDEKARELAAMFDEHFRPYAGALGEDTCR